MMEVEIRLGIFKEKFFETSLSKELFDKLINNSELKKKKDRIMIKIIKKNKEGYNLHYKDNELDKIEKYNKSLIHNNDLPEFSVRMSKSEEKTKFIRKLVKQKMVEKILLKIRTEYRHKTIKSWRWDFTRLYSLNIDCKTMETYNKLLKSTKLDLTLFDPHNLKYQCEMEYIGKKVPKKMELPNSLEKWVIKNYTKILKETEYFKEQKIIEVQNYIKETTKPSIVKALEKKYYDNILKGNFSVGEKIDGTRKFLYFDTYGNLYELAQFFETISEIKSPNQKIYKTLIDTEKVGDKYYCFDILISNGKNLKENTFLERRVELEKVIEKIDNKDFSLKEFITAMTRDEILKASKEMYEKEKDYEKDGLIFTYNHGNYREASYKWKPLRELTIDFLLINSEEPKLYSTLHTKAIEKYNLKRKDVIQETKKILKDCFNISRKVKPENYLILSDIKLSKDEIDKYDNINTGSIIECYYDQTTKEWKIHRLREDKTLRFKSTLNGAKILGPNAYLTAHNTIKLIEEPVNLF